MSDSVIKILDNLGEKFGLAIDWGNQNIIPHMQELMRRYANLCTAKAITWTVLFIILFTLLIIAIIKIGKWYSKGDIDLDSAMSGVVAIGLIMVVLIGFIICNLFKIYQNIFTPELVFLEYIKTLCGGM